ncbi:MAG: DUF1844 domain-containing protein [Planctomycetaceae bacterium]|nr:DUF1844 domain-containing protein [Planctomycetaceae bacterium]
MNEEQHPERKPIEIVGDEDWKTRVKEEDAALDAQFGSSEPREKPAGAESSGIDASQLPPANFSLLVTLFTTQAMTALGLLPNPMTGKAAPELPLAKHYIDLLSVLEQKTRGNLDAGEARLLGDSLHELRMMFVQQSKVNA